mmetsp:Transcript_11546/g.16171  ORF Transcript_11546/g.16171 Transcript_11546/m.16171 type:complete len:200 (-) Transcript_11546:256-855(-)
MMRDEKGNKSNNKTKATFLKLCCKFDSSVKEFIGPFVMAPVNSNAVRRSNSLLGYSSSLRYEEVETHANCMSAWLSVLQTLWFATAIAFPPWKAVMMQFLPSPGQGASKEEMSEGYLKVTAFARSSQGTKIIVRMGFSTDPGYEDTARMLVECGMCTLQEDVQKEGKSGCVTPACVFGYKLVERLQQNGRGIFLSVSSD